LTRDGRPAAGVPVGKKVVINRARYGLLDDPNRTFDVTDKLATRLRDSMLSVRAWSDIAGDPAPNIQKTLQVEYTVDGEPKTAAVQDGQTLRISEAHLPDRPDAELQQNGKKLVAWQPGRYEIQTALGKTIGVEVASVRKPLRLEGPWQLAFPPQPPYGQDTPQPQSLDDLISWHAHPLDAVKYFSGTAVYRNTFDCPELPADRSGWKASLDLGRVEVIAAVILNGRNLGILWKVPFRLDVTDVLNSGPNELEVRVTNLWPNRLIGDERKAPYLKWHGERGGPA
jgi:hypothetical protein